MIVFVVLWLFISFLICGKVFFGFVVLNIFILYGLGMILGSGYFSDDVFVGNNGCNWGVCGVVVGVLCGVVVIVFRSLFSFVFCLVNEYLSCFKIVFVSWSFLLIIFSFWKVLFWFNCYKKI